MKLRERGELRIRITQRGVLDEVALCAAKHPLSHRIARGGSALRRIGFLSFSTRLEIHTHRLLTYYAGGKTGLNRIAPRQQSGLGDCCSAWVLVPEMEGCEPWPSPRSPVMTVTFVGRVFATAWRAGLFKRTLPTRNSV